MMTVATAALTAALAFAPPSVTVDPVGEWSPGMADISGTARCDDSGSPGGNRGQLRVYVRDTAGFTRAYGTGTVVCDGAPHEWSVTALGSTVQPGTVRVTAILLTQTGSATSGPTTVVLT